MDLPFETLHELAWEHPTTSVPRPAVRRGRRGLRSAPAGLLSDRRGAADRPGRRAAPPALRRARPSRCWRRP